MYGIRNVVNGRIYVGCSIDTRSRWIGHRRLLNKGTHHCRQLQHDWNAYGADAFRFEVIRIVPKNEDTIGAESQVIRSMQGEQLYNSPQGRAAWGDVQAAMATPIQRNTSPGPKGPRTPKEGQG